MKGLNIKKVVAIGIGAALVGSALAPIVSAANMVDGGLTVVRGDIVDSMGAPVVDVVVGSGAAVSDVVWAGNIAAKVAQLATTSVQAGAGSGSVTNATVDVTVGGTTSISGAGESVDTPLVATQEFDISVTSTKMPTLVNNTSFKYKWNDSTQQTGSVQETIDGNMDVSAQMETGTSRYAAGELVATVAEGALEYNITLGTPLVLATVAGKTGLDSNSMVDLSLPILGKTYVLDEVSTDKTRLVFYANTAPTDLTVGESVTVSGKGTYLGKELTVELVDLIQTGSGNTDYQAKWALMDGTTIIKYIQKVNTATYNLKDEFGDVFSDNVYVTAAGLNLAANTYTATIRTGSDRLEIRNGYGFPYTGESTVDSKAQWKASFNTTTLAGITISNQWKYNKTIGSETDTTKYVLKVGESIMLPNDFAKFEFNGFQEKPSVEVTLGNGALNYVDLKGTSIDVPFYTQFDVEKAKTKIINVSGKDYTFWFENNNFTYVEGDKSSAETQAALEAVSGATTVTGFAAGTDTNTVSLDLGARPYSGSTIDYIDYVVDVNYVTGSGFLLLANQTFDIYSKNHTDSTIVFEGTQDVNVDQYAYYRPNMSEFLVDVLATTRNDKNYYAARFLFNDSTDVNLYVRADETGNVWNYNSLADLDSTYNKMGPSIDAENAAWSTTAIRDGADYLQAAATAYGTEIVSDNSVFTLVVPEEQRNVQAYLGSTSTVTTAVGGQSLTGIAVGGTDSTTAGTQITIDAVAGSCSVAGGEAVSVVAVPKNLVKVDASTYGKSIIVGGFAVNAAAKNLEISAGQTLENMLTADGEYVAAVLTSGNIVVAGFNANDTGAAATELINALEALI